MFTEISGSEKNKLIEEFKRNFVNTDYDPSNQKISRLLWCNLSCGDETIPTEKFENISVERNANVYFYSERDDTLYSTVFSETIDFIKNLEPWEDIDAEIFDKSFTWFIAVTHEDFCIVFGAAGKSPRALSPQC